LILTGVVEAKAGRLTSAAAAATNILAIIFSLPGNLIDFWQA
jgi:hypothetical protein